LRSAKRYVATVIDYVRFLLAQIGQHRIQRSQVAVDVRDDGDTHWRPITSPLD
jgi:hypothetical protein